MIQFIKKVTKMGTRRFIEVPQDYYDAIQVGDRVYVQPINKKEVKTDDKTKRV